MAKERWLCGLPRRCTAIAGAAGGNPLALPSPRGKGGGNPQTDRDRWTFLALPRAALALWSLGSGAGWGRGPGLQPLLGSEHYPPRATRVVLELIVFKKLTSVETSDLSNYAHARAGYS